MRNETKYQETHFLLSLCGTLYEIINLLEKGSGDLEKEREVLDKHEDNLSAIVIHIQKLIDYSSTTVGAASSKKTSLRKLAHVERHLKDNEKALTSIGKDHDAVPLLKQYKEQMSNVKRELSRAHRD